MKACVTGESVPTYKKGCRKDPGGYSPIALLSAAQRGFGAEIAIGVTSQYKYSRAHPVLQKKTGIETLSNKHNANQMELKYSALLHMKSTYIEITRKYANGGCRKKS